MNSVLKKFGIIFSSELYLDFPDFLCCQSCKSLSSDLIRDGYRHRVFTNGLQLSLLKMEYSAPHAHRLLLPPSVLSVLLVMKWVPCLWMFMCLFYYAISSLYKIIFVTCVGYRTHYLWTTIVLIHCIYLWNSSFSHWPPFPSPLTKWQLS